MRAATFQISYGATHNLPDATAFIDLVKNLYQHPNPRLRQFFDREAEIVVARAPGRLDVMGGIADYSGSLVLQLPLRQATFVALQRDPSRRLTIISLLEDSSQELAFEMPLTEWETADGPINYDAARSRFLSNPARAWAAYVAGVFLVLMRERSVNFSQGARILITSQVPQGKGVSSSASLEVAVMQAVAAAFDVHMEAREMALLCQRVENLVVGAPCGVMDQMTSACGEANCLLALLCQPAELRGTIVIPDQIAFWGLDSGVRHAISGADYGSVRVGTFMGYRILADLAGFNARETAAGAVQIDDPPWGGYLANVTPSEFEQTYVAQLPERIGGADFLSRYRGTTDPVTRVTPDRSYAVRAPTAHAIYEHNRVRLFAELIDAGATERRIKLLGELMYQSHASYSACGLGSARTDRLVQLVREAGPSEGLYGAKITGGGSGGTVAVLGRRDAGESVIGMADKYARETGCRPHIFSESSPGSAAFGYLKLRNP